MAAVWCWYLYWQLGCPNPGSGTWEISRGWNKLGPNTNRLSFASEALVSEGSSSVYTPVYILVMMILTQFCPVMGFFVCFQGSFWAAPFLPPPFFLFFFLLVNLFFFLIPFSFISFWIWILDLPAEEGFHGLGSV